MALETGSFIDDLVITNPVSASDLVRYGAGHLRLIKDLLKNSFAGSGGAILVAAADASAVANTITLTPSPVLTEYTTRMLVVWLQAVTNTGATTINISGLGAKAVVSIANAALASGDLVAGRVYVGVYDGTSVQLLAVTKNYVDQLAFSSALPAKPNDGNEYVTKELNNTVSWSRLKTIGGESLFGTGDIVTGISTVGATVTDNYTILTATPTIWPCATTAIGKCVTAPAANGAGMTKGLFAVIDNKAGGYPVGYRDSTGALVGAVVAAGGVAHVYLEDNSTAAGTWRMVGTNLEPGLITIDNTFSSTYASTVLKPFVALDDNKSIHFLALASGFAAVAVDKTTGTVGTPVTVTATGGYTPRAVFKITSTTAIVFYSSGNGATSSRAVVISLSGATALAMGVEVTGAGNAWGADTTISAPKIAQLSATTYLASFDDVGSNTLAQAYTVASTTITVGATANIIAANSVSDCTTTFALTATTGAVLYKSGAAAPYANNVVVITVNTGTAACTVGTPAAMTNCASARTEPASNCQLSATKILLVDSNNTTQVTAQVATISGTSVSAGTVVNVETGFTTSDLLTYGGSSATRYNPHLFPLSASTALLWYLDSSGISRAVVLSESGGTVTKGNILYRSISTNTSAATGGGYVQPQGTSEFLSNIIYGVANAWKHSIIPHKISGTMITYGAGVTLADFGQNSTSTVIFSTRLSTGDSVITANGLGTALYVVRSNGDAINLRGRISIPNFNNSQAFPIAAVSSNRIVLTQGTRGTTVDGSTEQLRLLSVEICQ